MNYFYFDKYGNLKANAKLETAERYAEFNGVIAQADYPYKHGSPIVEFVEGDKYGDGWAAKIDVKEKNGDIVIEECVQTYDSKEKPLNLKADRALSGILLELRVSL